MKRISKNETSHFRFIKQLSLIIWFIVFLILTIILKIYIASLFVSLCLLLFFLITLPYWKVKVADHVFLNLKERKIIAIYGNLSSQEELSIEYPIDALIKVQSKSFGQFIILTFQDNKKIYFYSLQDTQAFFPSYKVYNELKGIIKSK